VFVVSDKPIIQPAEIFVSQNELTLLREENEGLEEELKMLATSTEVRRVRLLEGEVKKLRGLLDRMNKKVKDLEEEIKDLEELVEDQEGKIAEVEALQEEVDRLEDINKLMWRRWKEFLTIHPEIELEYL
jgi:predicted RNase H-like nuclease (RuvC/YqgF family)